MIHRASASASLRHGSVLCLAVLFLAVPSAARAERAFADELPALRAALASYDVEGDTTLSLLDELGRRAASAGDESSEARALRALVAADLLVVSRADARWARLEDRLASSYGVPTLALVPTLARELESVRGGVYRAVVEDALSALALIDEVDAPIPIDWTRHAGVRRDVLFLRAVATGALRAGSALDPCADARDACPAPWSGWDAPTRARIAALREASDAARRLEAAAAGGDPLVTTLATAIAEHRAALEGARVEPAVWLASRGDLMPAQAGDAPIRVERLLVIGRDSVDALHARAVTVRGGRVVSVDGEDGLGLSRAPFAIASLGPSMEEPLRAGLGTIVRGAALAVAPTEDASCEVLWRVLAAARRMGVGSIALVRRAPDGTLAGRRIELASEPAPDARGEVVVRVRPAYLVIERGEERSLIERTRGEGGLAVDLPELERALRRGAARRVAVTFAGEARAADVVEIALALASRARSPIALAVQ